jgi:hypothetical protein
MFLLLLFSFILVKSGTCEQYAMVFQQEGAPGTKAASIFIFNSCCDGVAVNVSLPASPGTLRTGALLQKIKQLPYP